MAPFTLTGFLVSQWASLPVPDLPLDGKTAIVTGSNVGLGFEAARHLCRLNAATVIIAVRNTAAGEEAATKIRASLPNCKTSIQVWKIDQSSFASVKSFTDRVSTLPGLDIAILNAGLASDVWNVTEDGWERTIQVNVLSTTYLALLLLPKLRGSVSSSSAFKPHLSIVASDTHYWTPFEERKQLEILKTLNDKAHFNPGDRYQLSKLLDVYITQGIASYVTKNYNSEVVVNCLNPGLCHSELARDAGWGLYIMKLFLARSTEKGSRTLVHAATVAEDESMGKYLNGCKVTEPADLVISEEGQAAQLRVWKEVGGVLEKLDPTLKQYFE